MLLGIVIFGIGALLFSSSFASVTNMTMINSGELNDGTGHYYAAYGTVASSSATYYSSPASIQWTTNIASTPFMSYLYYVRNAYPYWDWSQTPILSLKINPQSIPAYSTLNFILLTANVSTGTWIYSTFTVSGLTANTWNTLTFDLRFPASQELNPNLTRVSGWVFWLQTSSAIPADFSTFVDNVEVNPSSGQTPTPPPSPTPTPTPTAGPTPTPPPTQWAVTISTSTGSIGGSTNPSGTVNVNSGSSLDVTASPNNGYTFSNWAFDGASYSTSPTVTILPQTAGTTHTLVANFILETEPPPPPPSGQWAINIAATAGGTVSQLGVQNMDSGASLTVTATPDSGYMFSKWIFDGSDYGVQAQVTVSPQAEGSSHTLQAVFTQNAVPTPPPGQGGIEGLPYNMLIGVSLMAVGVTVVATAKKQKPSA